MGSSNMAAGGNLWLCGSPVASVIYLATDTVNMEGGKEKGGGEGGGLLKERFRNMF